MQVVVDIPDHLVSLIIPHGLNPSRAVLEDALLEAYREERISSSQLMEALGITTRYDLDGYLKAHQIWIEYTPEMVAADQRLQESFVAERVSHTGGR